MELKKIKGIVKAQYDKAQKEIKTVKDCAEKNDVYITIEEGRHNLKKIESAFRNYYDVSAVCLNGYDLDRIANNIHSDIKNTNYRLNRHLRFISLSSKNVLSFQKGKYSHDLERALGFILGLNFSDTVDLLKASELKTYKNGRVDYSFDKEKTDKIKKVIYYSTPETQELITYLKKDLKAFKAFNPKYQGAFCWKVRDYLESKSKELDARSVNFILVEKETSLLGGK